MLSSLEEAVNAVRAEFPGEDVITFENEAAHIFLWTPADGHGGLNRWANFTHWPSGLSHVSVDVYVYLLRQTFLLTLSPFRLTDFFDGAGTTSCRPATSQCRAARPPIHSCSIALQAASHPPAQTSGQRGWRGSTARGPCAASTKSSCEFSSPPFSPRSPTAEAPVCWPRRYPRMAPHQRAVLVPGAFGGSRFHACDADCFDSMMAADAKAFGSWAFEDERVDGVERRARPHRSVG